MSDVNVDSVKLKNQNNDGNISMANSCVMCGFT